MDRLYDTLEDKMKEWTGCQRSLWKETFSSCYGDPMDHEYIRKDLMTQRLLVAHDIASAFDYMHTNKVLHRDIKPQNMGFDVRGNIKVFDFGLAKSLVPELQAQCGLLYNLTAKSGSLPYMAPEVAMSKPYNEKCDVYSFGILFYEIVALKPPFSQHVLKNYTAKVLKGGARPPIKRTFPSCTKKILKSSWSVSHTNRPDMATIVKLIQSDVELLEQGALVHARSNHMMNLSKHSLNGGRDDKKSSSQGFDDDKHPVKVLSVF
ncbi:protein tyrosine kinase [Fragilaria crotonensis]|nr:protein tyrosine kinase [Fragilaria crotonensis]